MTREYLAQLCLLDTAAAAACVVSGYVNSCLLFFIYLRVLIALNAEERYFLTTAVQLII